MDADWSVEIGEGLPWIDVPWEGWVDLRDRSTAPERLRALSEVAAYPELAEVLLEINTNHRAALTSKCDVFPIDSGATPPAMMDSEGSGAHVASSGIQASEPSGIQAPEPDADSDADFDTELRYGLGSYIDLCFSVEEAFSNFAWCESLVRRVATELLAPIPMPRTSVELVIRQASFFDVPGYGLTLYAMGFGRDLSAARAAWAHVMRFSAYITMLEVTGRVTARLKQDQRE